MGRRRALTLEQEQQLAAVVGLGLTREAAGRAFGVSVRTVARSLARMRARPEPETLEELLRDVGGEVAGFDPLAVVPADPRRPPRRRRREPWEAVARELGRERPEHWGLGGRA
jgi:hypothetical protein